MTASLLQDPRTPLISIMMKNIFLFTYYNVLKLRGRSFERAVVIAKMVWFCVLNLSPSADDTNYVFNSKKVGSILAAIENESA